MTRHIREVRGFDHLPDPHPMDTCTCGDYRHQHDKGMGRCLLGSGCFPAHCQKFTPFQVYVGMDDREQPQYQLASAYRASK